MPLWGWICTGLAVLAFLLFALFYVFAVIPHNRTQKRLKEHGQTVVARIILANTTLYNANTPAAFEFAFVVYTMDNDASEGHLDLLGQIERRLQDFTPDEDDPVEKKIRWALDTQRTVGEGALRIPDRVTGGKEAYFSTVGVFRRLLPEGKLTRDYLCLRVLINDQYRDVSMIEYPDAAE